MKAIMGPDVLSVRNLIVIRGIKKVVNAINFDVTPGRITAMLGANGAGKSSTVLSLAGVVPPVFGNVYLDGKDLTDLKRPEEIRRAGVAAVPEGHQVLRELSVRDNLRAAGPQLSRAALNNALDEVLSVFAELKEKINHRASDLSGGQQQMVSLAQAMMSRPRFLLIDELSMGLAPTIVLRLMPIVRDIAKSGVGVLLIEQFTSLALKIAQDAYIMSRGEITYEGSAERLQNDPALLHRAYFATELPGGVTTHRG